MNAQPEAQVVEPSDEPAFGVNPAPVGGRRLGDGDRAVLFAITVVVWLVALDFVYTHTWDWGVETSALLLAMAAISIGVWELPELPRRAFRGRTTAAVLCVLAAAIAGYQLRDGVRSARRPNPGVADMSASIRSAIRALAVDKRNPYATRNNAGCGDIRGRPHVTVDPSGNVRLFGLPYDYGFPYFPGYLLSYWPFEQAFHNPRGMIVANLFWVVLSILGMFVWLGRGRTGLAALAAILFAANPTYQRELYDYVIPDLILGLYILAALLLFDRRHPIAAGVALGLSQASKLLPAPFFLLPLLFALDGRGRWRLLAGFAVTALAVLLPFVLADPTRFVSSTFLYYLVDHAAGDSTAGWFFVPHRLQPWFLGVGYLATAVVWVLFSRRCRTATHAASVGFGAWLMFAAFSKMIHLNYIWGALAPGCVGLVAATWRREETLRRRPAARDEREHGELRDQQGVEAGAVPPRLCEAVVDAE